MSDELTSAISFLEQELTVVESKAEALRSALRVLRAKADADLKPVVREPSAPKATEPDEDELWPAGSANDAAKAPSISSLGAPRATP